MLGPRRETAVPAVVKHQSGSFPRVPSFIALSLLVGAAVLRLPGLTLNSFWLDEMTTVWLALLPPKEFAKTAMYDGHTPSFNLLVWIWARLFGTSEFALRSFPALIGIVTIPVCYLLFRKQLGEGTALAAAILLLFLPSHIYYSQELRAYSLVFLIAMLSTAALLQYLEKPTARNRWMLACACSALIAVHYLSVLVAMIVMLVAVLGIKATPADKLRKAEELILTTYFVASPFFAQLLVRRFLTRYTDFWRLEDVSVWEQLRDSARGLFHSQDVLMILYMVLALSAVIRVLRMRDRVFWSKCMTLLALAILPVAGVLALYFVTADFLLVSRTGLVFFAPMLLVVALGATSSKNPLITGGVLIFSTAVSVWWLVDSQYYTVSTKSDWRGAAEEIARLESQHGGIVCVNLERKNVHRKYRSAYLKEGKLQYYFDMFGVQSDFIDIPAGAAIVETIRASAEERNVSTIALVSLHELQFPQVIEACDDELRKVSVKRFGGKHPDQTFVFAYALD